MTDIKFKYDYKMFFLRIAIVLTIAFSVAAIYSNSVKTPYQLDDQHMVEKNREIQNINNYLKPEQWLGMKLNRVLPRLTLALDFHFCEREVECYHITNIAIHIINSLLVYWLILLLFKFEVMRKETVSAYSQAIAFWGAMIFAVHPMQMQAVTYISQRLASISALFYLLGTAFYIKARLSNIDRKLNARSIAFYLLTLFSFYLGMRSKQNIVTLPLALLAVELFFVRNRAGKIYKRYVLIYSVVSVIAALVFILFIGIPHAAEAPSSSIYLATQFRALLVYIGKLFIPISQKLYYDLPFSNSFWGTTEILSFLVLLGILSTALLLYKKTKLLSFGIIWFFITMLVESSIFPLKYSFFEYRVYPGMFGYALFLSSLFFYIIPKIKPQISGALLTAIILLYANATVQINKVWIDPITLWKDNVKKTPEYAVPYANVGTYYFKQDKIDSALFYYNRALEIDSSLSDAYLNRGTLFLKEGNLDAALRDLNKAIEYKKNDPLPLNNRGYLYLKIGNYQKAIEDFKSAISLQKQYSQAYSNLCIAYNEIGEYKKAFKAINRAIEIKENQPEFYINRGNLHFSIGDYHVAAANYNKAFLIDTLHYKALNNLAIAHRALKNFEKSVEYSTRALEINDKYIPAYLNRAMSRYSLGDKDGAMDDVETCLRIAPYNIQAQILKGALMGKEKVAVKIAPEFVYQIQRNVK